MAILYPSTLGTGNNTHQNYQLAKLINLYPRTSGCSRVIYIQFGFFLNHDSYSFYFLTLGEDTFK